MDLRMLRIFREREPALILTGRAISNFGDGVANVAVTLIVLDLAPHQPTYLAILGAARLVPTVVFLLFGGVIVDRFSRRRILLLSDSVRAGLTGAIAVLAAAGILRFWEIVVWALLFGLFDAVFMPALTALTPEIVPEELLGAMNAVRPLTNQVMGTMIGPVVGAALFVWNSSAALFVDAASFVASAVAIYMMRPTPAPTRHETNSTMGDIKEGLNLVRRTTWLWTTLALAAFTNALIMTPTSTFTAYFLRHNLNAPKVTVGWAIALSGIAGAAATVVVGSRPLPRRRVRTMWIWWTAANSATLIFAVATNVWWVFLIGIISAPGIVIGNVIWESMLQSEIPREMLGRVSSVDWFVSLGLSPIGLIVAGVLIGHVGVATYFVTVSLLALVPSVAMIVSRRVNEVDLARVAPQSPEPTG